MTDLELVEESLQVPSSTGMEGFILVIRKILKLSKVQSIHIDASGRMTWSRLAVSAAAESQDWAGEALFDKVSPGFIIRNNDIEELEVPLEPLQGIARIFQKAALQHLHPVAWVSGPRSAFWAWHARAVGFSMSAGKDEVYGFPFLYDKEIPEDTLILCTAYERGSAMIDVKKSFKLVMLNTAPVSIPHAESFIEAPAAAVAEVPPKAPLEGLPDLDLGDTQEGGHE